MIKIKIILAALLFSLTISAASAHAPYYSGFCGNRIDIVKILLEKHNEVPIGIAETSSGDVLEIFSSPNGKTFSIIATKKDGDGFACFVTEGHNLQLKQIKVKTEPPKNGDA